MLNNKTYKKEVRKILYLSSELSELFDAYAFHLYEKVNYRMSRCGNIMVRSFFKTMPEHEKKSLIDKYNAHRIYQNKMNDDGN
jgi:hypothetical protein